MRAHKRISLADELAELAAVLESAQLIAELLDTGAMPDAESAPRRSMMTRCPQWPAFLPPSRSTGFGLGGHL